MTDTILSQILSICNSGIINMCDSAGVQQIAYKKKYFELVLYIEEDPVRYFHFILYGKEPDIPTSST